MVALAEDLRTSLDSADPSAPGTELIRESFDRVMAMLRRDDEGWSNPLFGSDPIQGLSLENLKDWGRKIRPSVVGAPWIGQGFRLRYSYVWRDGMQYADLPASKKKLMDTAQNQANFFGVSARRKRELSLYADGVAFWIGNSSTKQLEAIPLAQITDQFLDPNGSGEIWAYRREWTERSLTTGKAKDIVRWYFSDLFVDKRVKTIKVDEGSQREQVDQQHVIFAQNANPMTGMAYGSPDALAAYVWNDVVRDSYYDGITMTRAMATFAFKASVGSKKAGEDGSLKYAGPEGPGSTAVLGVTNDLVPMSSAGKGYDFTTLRSLTAIIAASLGISNIALTADTAAAGSSYGAAQTLETPVQFAMEVRREEHVEFEARILAWMGAKNASAYFIPFASDSDIYRKVQAAILKWNTGLYSEEEMKAELSAILGDPTSTPVPKGVMLPNNEKTVKAQQPKEQTSSTPAPDQGSSNGTGGQDSSGDDLK